MHGSRQSGAPRPPTPPPPPPPGVPPDVAGRAGPGEQAAALEREVAELREEVAQLQEEVAQLRAALSRRPVIDLAKGVVMALTGCDETQAFRELSQISQTHNVKLFDLA